MRPLADMPEVALADAVGVASDVDDTLTSHGALVVSAVAALDGLKRAGVPCVLVTGRPLGWAEVLARTLPVRAVVTENGGAWVVREGARLRVAFLEDEAVRAEGMARVNRAVDHIVESLPGLGRVQDLTRRATDVALDIGEVAHVPLDVVERAKAIVSEHGLHAVASSVHLHISARVPDKVQGLRAVVDELGLDGGTVASRWLYVGDSPNDAGAFAAMDLSCGVAGVRVWGDRMPAWPKYICDGGAGDGFAEVCARLLAARGVRA